MLSAVRNIIPKCHTLNQAINVINQQIRTTFILKRKFAPFIHKKNMKPKPLKPKHYVYELIKDTTCDKQELLKLILTSNIEGLGNKGDLVEVKSNYGYNNLILLQKAVYATEENIKKFANLEEDIEKPSSPYVPLSMQTLSRITLSVIMNRESPWTLQPWHIRVAFRKCGWVVPERAISLPEYPIKGPDMNLQNKEFFVTVEFSPKERQQVRCLIHHWSTELSDRLPYVKEFWKLPTESIYVETEYNEKPVNS
ncbi:hypothetical protein HHI36_002312 [Cryptolaemus montrouzieri]|uniref:Large ribosomal subunit protein bL9m n=1 Tax=Cryptolaemus montrouzieri TaxID=559131 RepID=A0ABD2PA28_9CUCU